MMHQMLYPAKNVTSFATAPGSVAWVIIPFWYSSKNATIMDGISMVPKPLPIWVMISAMAKKMVDLS